MCLKGFTKRQRGTSCSATLLGPLRRLETSVFQVTHENILQTYYRKIEHAWIGLNDQVKEGKFVWVGPMYTNWGPGEPNNAGNEDCVEIVTAKSYGKTFEGRWNDKSCNNKFSFICQN